MADLSSDGRNAASAGAARLASFKYRSAFILARSITSKSKCRMSRLGKSTRNGNRKVRASSLRLKIEHFCVLSVFSVLRLTSRRYNNRVLTLHIKAAARRAMYEA